MINANRPIRAGLRDRRGFLAGLAASGVVFAAAAAHAVDLSTAQEFGFFLPRGYRPGVDDASSALEAAARWSAGSGRAVTVSGTHLLARPAVLDTPGAALNFANATIRVADGGRMRRMRTKNDEAAAIVVAADRVALVGSATFVGLGTPGRTHLTGMYFDEVADVEVGNFTFKNFAFGQHFMCCDRVRCGDTRADGIWGKQHGNVGAGSAQVVSGCRDSRFGALSGTDIDKSARYLSLGIPARGGTRDNQRNTFGFVQASGRPGSPWAQVMGVRSSRDSTFAGGSGTNMSYLLLLQKYATDAGYAIDNNDFGNWSGEIVETASSLQAAFYADAQTGGGEIGSNRVGKLIASNRVSSGNEWKRKGSLPQTFGILSTSGAIAISEAALDGFTFQIQGFDSTVRVGTLRSARPGYTIVSYGRGFDVFIGTLSLTSAIAGPVESPGLIRGIDAGRSRRASNVDVRVLDCSAAPRDLRAADVILEPGSSNRVSIGTLRSRCGSGTSMISGRRSII